MSRARLPKLPPLEVAAARGCHGCLGLLLRAEEPLALQRSWSPAQEPGWSRRTLSFLTEDGSDGSETWVALGDIPEAGPLSSTRRSLLDEPGDSGVPSLWPDCSQEPRGDTAVPLPPLASSTLLGDRDLPQEPPPSHILGTRGSPSPILGDIPFPCPHFPGRVSLRQHQGGILGTHAVSPRSLLSRGGFSSCSVAPQSSADIPWGRAAVPYTVVTEAEDGDPADLGDSGSLRDNSESFVTARESLGGAPGGAAPAPTPRDLGLDLGQGLVSGRDLGQGLGLVSGRDLGRDLEQDLGQGLGLGQDLEQALGREGSGAAPQIPALPSDVGALLARLGGCTLGGSPPRYPPCPGSPGGVTPRGCDSLRVRHVTPRSRSRLRAVAARLRSCSSSLFPEALPISPRVPRVAVTSPPGHCVTAGDRVLPAVDGEGTGNSWGGTQIFSGLSPRGGSVPKSGPRVLQGLGDKGHPQNSLLLARGSPKPNPSVRPVPRNRPHPQKAPRVTRGVPSATSSPEPEGETSQSQWHLLAVRPPGSASRDLGTPSVSLSPSRELGTLSVPLSPSGDLETLSVPLSPGCATRRSESHQEDVMQEQAPRECHSPGGKDATSSPGSGTGQGGRVSLRDNPSPVTTWGQRRWPQGHSPELVATLMTGHVPDCAQDELALTRHFEQPECGRSWHGGRLKFSFNYLLLDPRITRDLPQRSPGLSPAELFRTFVSAVFYVGKGTRARPWWHLHQALAQHRRGTQRGGPKVQRILEIWASGHGVVPLQCFQHRLPAEALTRESCMLEALGLPALTNTRRGPCYGVAAAWPAQRRRRLGVLLLHRAMSVLLAEGECQLRPGDIPGVTPSTQG